MSEYVSSLYTMSENERGLLHHVQICESTTDISGKEEVYQAMSAKDGARGQRKVEIMSTPKPFWTVQVNLKEDEYLISFFKSFVFASSFCRRFLSSLHNRLYIVLVKRFRIQIAPSILQLCAPRRKIRMTESNAKCRHLKKLTCKGSLRKLFICLRPPPLLGFCLGGLAILKVLNLV